MIDTIPCPFCGKVGTLEATPEEITAFIQGAFVQDAFPNMAAQDRERLITGICPDCWAGQIGEEDPLEAELLDHWEDWHE